VHNHSVYYLRLAELYNENNHEITQKAQVWGDQAGPENIVRVIRAD
jgi:hypothetical protein